MTLLLSGVPASDGSGPTAQWIGTTSRARHRAGAASFHADLSSLRVTGPCPAPKIHLHRPDLKRSPSPSRPGPASPHLVECLPQRSPPPSPPPLPSSTSEGGLLTFPLTSLYSPSKDNHETRGSGLEELRQSYSPLPRTPLSHLLKEQGSTSSDCLQVSVLPVNLCFPLPLSQQSLKGCHL